MTKKIFIVLAICVYSFILSLGVDLVGRLNYGKRSTFFLTDSKEFYTSSDIKTGCRVNYKLPDQKDQIASNSFLSKLFRVNAQTFVSSPTGSNSGGFGTIDMNRISLLWFSLEFLIINAVSVYTVVSKLPIMDLKQNWVLPIVKIVA